MPRRRRALAKPLRACRLRGAKADDCNDLHTKTWKAHRAHENAERAVFFNQTYRKGEDRRAAVERVRKLHDKYKALEARYQELGC